MALHNTFKPRIRIAFALSLLAAALPAVAGSFSISPLRVELSDRKRIEALTVRNEQDSEAVIQVLAQAWTQSDGQDILQATRDVLATPAVFTLAPKGQQIIRVALRRPADTERELTYRILLQEVPNATSSDFNGLRVSLRLSLPIFVAPTGGASFKLDSALSWRTELRDEKLLVETVNTSKRHVQIFDCAATFDESTPAMRNSVGKYLLAGSRTSWTIAPPPNAGRQKTSFKLSCLTDQGEVDAELPVPR